MSEVDALTQYEDKLFTVVGYDPETGLVIGAQTSSHPFDPVEAGYDAWLVFEGKQKPTVRDMMVRDGQLVPRSLSLEDVRHNGLRRLRRLTSAARCQYVEKVRGQDTVHLRKAEEARRFLAMSSAPNDLSAFPMLNAEVGDMGPRELAELWIEKALETDAALARIEAARMTAKRKINKAESEAEIDAALKAFSIVN